MEQIRSTENYKALERELQPLKQIHDAQDAQKIAPAELEKMERELCKELVKRSHKERMDEYPFSGFREALLSSQEDVRAAVDSNMQAWFADAENLGAELKVAYDAFRTAEAEKAEDCAQKLEAFMDVYQKAVISRLTQMEDLFWSKKVDMSEPDDFVGSMSDVVSDNQKSSIWRMGIFKGCLFKWQMEREEKEDKQLELQDEQYEKHQKRLEMLESGIMTLVNNGGTVEELLNQRKLAYDQAAKSDGIKKEELDAIMEKALRVAVEKQAEREAAKQAAKQPEEEQPEQQAKEQVDSYRKRRRKSNRKSRRKSERKSQRNIEWKNRRKSGRKSQRNIERKNQRNIERKSRRKSERKSRRKSNRNNR